MERKSADSQSWQADGLQVVGQLDASRVQVAHPSKLQPKAGRWFSAKESPHVYVRLGRVPTHSATYSYLANSALVGHSGFASIGQLVTATTTHYEALKRLSEVETRPGVSPMGWGVRQGL